MNTEEKEVEVVTLEDGKEYTILDTIDINGIKYVYLSTDEENPKFRIRKIELAGNIEMLVALDSDAEFDKAMLVFSKNHFEEIR